MAIISASKPRILLIDNQDSFTHNIASLLEICLQKNANCAYKIVPYHDFTLAQLRDYSHILISPGPMTPQDYPKHFEVITHCLQQEKPLLGICLGHQSIGVYFGAKLLRLNPVAHGLCSVVRQNSPYSSRIFAKLPEEIRVGRYHSWALDKESIRSPLQITSYSADDLQVMAIAHKNLPIFGIQFHPESFLSPNGATLLHNFLTII